MANDSIYMKALLACWLTAVAVLVWLAMQPTSFAQRWPTVTQPVMSLELGRPQSIGAADVLRLSAA